MFYQQPFLLKNHYVPSIKYFLQNMQCDLLLKTMVILGKSLKAEEI